MCTVTVWPANDGLRVLFNRDESPGRASGQPPRIRAGERASYLAPLDPPSEGTWIAANERGFVACLLNADTEGEAPRAPGASLVSRGHIVPAVAEARDWAAAARAIENRPLERMRPFHCLVIGPRGDGWRWAWDGEALRGADAGAPPCFFSTSSRRPSEIVAARRARFEALAAGASSAGGPDAKSAFALHASAGETPSADTFRMRRTDARTVSITVVEARSDALLMAYYAVDEAGALDKAPARAELPRTDVAAEPPRHAGNASPRRVSE